MLIEAESDGVKSPTIKINRPRWSDMFENYPDNSITKYIFYPKISKALGKDVDHKAYVNTCALRMSVGLNKSGFLLPKAPSKGGNILGDDSRNYWLRVADLRPYLYKIFKEPDIAVTLPTLSSLDPYIPSELDERLKFVQDNIINKINGKKGIVVFEVKGWANATGHFTLWDGGENGLLYSPESENDPKSPNYYFWMVPNNNETEDNFDDYNSGLTIKFVFWELID